MTYPQAATGKLPFGAPAFDRIKNDDHKPAILEGMRIQWAEVEAIIGDPDPPDLENTIVALERTGVDLTRAVKVFFALTGSATNNKLQTDKAELVPLLVAHGDAITMNDRLFQRIRSVYDSRAKAGLDPVQQRLVERYYTRFVRAGALLDPLKKAQLRNLNEEEARLGTQFQDNILKGRTAACLILDRKEQLEGLSGEAVAAAADAARAKGLKDSWVIELINTTTQPVLASLKDREVRERLFRASVTRNSDGEFDNRPIVARLAQIRALKAELLGFPNWVSFVMDDQMAKNPGSVLTLLGGLASAAARNARLEATKLQAMADKGGADVPLAPWDWDYYCEQVRRAEHDIDEASLKPYLEFETVLIKGVFFAARLMYGLTFKERSDLPTYHPDVRVFNILDADGTELGLFYGDYYARDNKQGGAWMDSLVDQSLLLDQQPVITQVCNFVKPTAGQPCLLSFDDVTTLFHEFGHALHGMLSHQVYPLFSGTATSTDFVEFPSQINEALATDPTVLANYARHYKTLEPMPAGLVENMKKARAFNQGYLTSEYLAAALLDIEWHMLGDNAPMVEDVEEFERNVLNKYGLNIALVPPRYKTCYFSHSWCGGYAANYYAYLWSEVLDADGCAWFAENGGFNRTNGSHFRNTVLCQGGSKEGGQLYRDFAGRDARMGHLVARRGLNS